MTKEYRVWVSVWEYDTETEESTQIDTPEYFIYCDSEEQALLFAKRLDARAMDVLKEEEVA